MNQAQEQEYLERLSKDIIAELAESNVTREGVDVRAIEEAMIRATLAVAKEQGDEFREADAAQKAGMIIDNMKADKTLSPGGTSMFNEDDWEAVKTAIKSTLEKEEFKERLQSLANQNDVDTPSDKTARADEDRNPTLPQLGGDEAREHNDAYIRLARKAQALQEENDLLSDPERAEQIRKEVEADLEKYGIKDKNEQNAFLQDLVNNSDLAGSIKFVETVNKTNDMLDDYEKLCNESGIKAKSTKEMLRENGITYEQTPIGLGVYDTKENREKFDKLFKNLENEVAKMQSKEGRGFVVASPEEVETSEKSEKQVDPDNRGKRVAETDEREVDPDNRGKRVAETDVKQVDPDNRGKRVAETDEREVDPDNRGKRVAETDVKQVDPDNRGKRVAETDEREVDPDNRGKQDLAEIKTKSSAPATVGQTTGPIQGQETAAKVVADGSVEKPRQTDTGIRYEKSTGPMVVQAPTVGETVPSSSVRIG